MVVWSICLNLRTHQVPIEMFMDYVPDVAAFKVLNFKGADSYLCVVRAATAIPHGRRYREIR